MSLTPRSLLPLALVLACGPEKSESDSINTTSITDPTEGPPETTSSGTTEQPTTGDGTASTGEPVCAPGTIPGPLACKPPGETYAYFQFAFNTFAETYDAQCDVAAVTDDGTIQTLDLTCPDGQVSLDLGTSAPRALVAVDMGAKVRLHYEWAEDGERFAEIFILLDDADLPLAAGVNTPYLPAKLDPLTIEILDSDCDGEGGECAVTQRTGVQVTFGDASVTVFDGNFATLPSTPKLTLLVSDSTRTVCIGPDCGFSYSPSVTRALLVRE